MKRSNSLGEMLGALLESPRNMLRSNRDGSVEDLCTSLLKERTEVASLEIATDILGRFSAMNEDEQSKFFNYLNDELDLDVDRISKAISSYGLEKGTTEYRELAQSVEPRRYELLRRLNQAPGATAELVRMRSALLDQKKKDPSLGRTDADFAFMLRSWFNRGFLVLRQITWDSPASILEKIIAYEAVHEIGSWEELRRRLHPADRRCFAFFHPAMPEEPLIFVEVALSKGIPGSIQDVLTDTREILDEGDADTAVFYSISNCQRGLAGISFGNSLIKQVVRDLVMELPSISSFVTLSPIPGLRRWIDKNELEGLAEDPAGLRKLAAHYLVNEKIRETDPLDPVARFHLGNGAQVHAIHAGADLSDNGKKIAYGAMVNYAYELKKITENLKQFGATGQVATSSAVRGLARQGTTIVNRKNATQKTEKIAKG